MSNSSGGVSLPRPLQRKLAPARLMARQERIRIYLVGGAVRDLLLGRETRDVDLVVEADAVRFARRLARRLHLQVTAHERFGTATLEQPDGTRLDLATARRETYERPGALPRVEPASIAEDLARRDFTINAMALEIAPGRRLKLHDPFHGMRDLKSRRVRMLHPRSPFDDPTRAFRAVRYANRLGFTVETQTRAWIRAAVRQEAFEALSGDRLRREVRLLFSEGNRAGAVRLLGTLGLDATLHKSLRCDGAVLARLRRAERLARRSPSRTTWFLYLLVWASGLSTREVEALSDRLSLGREAGRLLRRWPATLDALSVPRPVNMMTHREGRCAPPARRATEVYQKEIRRRKRNAAGGDAAALECHRICGARYLGRVRERSPRPTGGRRLSLDEIGAVAVALAHGRRRRLLEGMLSGEEPPSLRIGGRDLVRAGIPPGPAIGRALEKTLGARLSGMISAEEELGFAVSVAREASS